MARSGSLKKAQMKRVATNPRRARGTMPKRARVPVVRTPAQIKGYPALAMGKAVWLGFSAQE
jgi:hypothetical protein